MKQVANNPELAKQRETFLRTHFPHVPLEWLEYLEERLAYFSRRNGGNVEMSVRWRNGVAAWSDWTSRDILTN